MIYWLITLPKIANGMGSFLMFFGILGVILIPIVWGMVKYIGEINFKFPSGWLYVSIAGVVVGGLLSTFIPSTKEIVAIYAIPKVVNNEQVQQIPEKLLEYANLKLDDLIQSVPSKE